MISLMLIIAWTYRSLPHASFLLYDDDSLITSNPLVHTGDVVKIFSSFSAGLYHPLTTLSWALEANFFGFDPRVFHTSNILLHMISTIVVWLFAKRLWLTKSWISPFLLAALFALHPLNVESVSWISERKDLLCQVFYLLALYAHAGRLPGQIPSKQRWLVVFMFSIAAMLAKPMAVTLPVVLILVDFYIDAPNWHKRQFVEKIPHLIVALVIAGLTIWGQTTARSESPLSLDVPTAVLNAGKFLTFTLSKAIWPNELSAIYEANAIPVLWPYLLRVFLFITIFTFSWIKLTKWRRDAAFGLALFCVTILPVVRILQFGDASLFNDRFFYLPGLGFLWAMISLSSYAIEQAKHQKIIRGMAATIWLTIITACAYASHERSLVWKNDETLMKSVISTYPRSIKARTFLAQYLAKNNRHAEAAVYFREAIQLDSTDPVVYSGLAHSSFSAGQKDEAISVISYAQQKWPTNSEILYAAGVIALESGELPRAYQNLNDALNAPSTMPTPYRLVQIARIYNNLAVTALRLNNPSEALTFAQQAVSGVGDLLPEAHYNHGIVLRALARSDEAAASLQRALYLSPDLHEAAADLAILLWEKSKQTEAIDMLQRAIAIAPNNTLYRCNLVHFYAKTNNLKQARETLEQIRKIDPSASCLRTGHSNQGQ